MKHILTASILVATLAVLSACTSASFVERRAEICPTCTDSEWRVKVQENAAEKAAAKARYDAIRKQNAIEAGQRARDEQAFYNKYPRCFHKYKIERGFMGVTSPQFLALCEEYVKDNS